ncbi:Os10g0468301, partial [Oryza sativa Japonica Group]
DAGPTTSSTQQPSTASIWRAGWAPLGGGVRQVRHRGQQPGPSIWKAMPSKGSSQMTMTNQRNLSDRRAQQPLSQVYVDVDSEHGTAERQEIGTAKRARWSHQMKMFLIELLTDHDVPGFRTQNAWSKEAWTNIVCRLNTKFGTSFTTNQVKQKEQDLKKDYRSVKDLLDQSGFGWDSDRMMVSAPQSVWDTFADRKNKDAIHWRDKSFPYFDDLAPLYDGRYAEGRTRHGMDHYARKTKNAPAHSTQEANAVDTYQSPSPNSNAPGESGLQFPFGEEVETANLDFSQHSPTPVHLTKVPPSSAQTPSEVPESRPGKKQKIKSVSPDDGFHERYLKLKKEDIDRFAAIEEKKLEDPYSINKCITVLEGLHGLQIGDILVAADIFKGKDNREVFLSFSSDALRLAWIRKEIAALE